MIYQLLIFKNWRFNIWKTLIKSLAILKSDFSFGVQCHSAEIKPQWHVQNISEMREKENWQLTSKTFHTTIYPLSNRMLDCT